MVEEGGGILVILFFGKEETAPIIVNVAKVAVSFNFNGDAVQENIIEPVRSKSMD